ncbi:MAG TPA: lytic transglycosylase domain-containing protein [Aliiroseovarius sp.]|nr:lytic transglycosylase domain-containing protein [Aliiroseovarius sp.]
MILHSLRFLRAGIVFVLFLFPAAPAMAAENPAFVSSLKRGLELMRADDWDAAIEAAGPEGSVRRDIILWHYLRASKGTFTQALEFLERRPNWPGLKLLRKRAEVTIPVGTDPALVRGFFAAQPPQTGAGALRLAEALRAQGRDDEARALAIRAWRTLPMGKDDEAEFLATYGAALKRSHWQRLDRLLWAGSTTAARRMLPRVSEGRQKLALARITLRADESGVDAMINAIPKALMDDPGLAYERFLWRARKGRNQDAIDLLLARSASADKLGDPARWGSWRRSLARWSMREGKARQAYRLAANHHLGPGADRNDLEWLAGYIALTRLDDPATALRHFQAFQGGVESPISLGRAGYWLGRAHEALGEHDMALQAWRFGAEFQVSFYGQLAAQKAGLGMDPALVGARRYPGWQQAGFWRDSNMVAARLLEAADELYLALRFTQQMSETLTPEEAGQLLDWAEAVEAPYLQVKLAKYLIKTRGLLYERAYFALPKALPARDGVPPEFALAIMRRESEFKPDVRSGVGALGLMQLMPGTARDMARDLGLGYSEARLISDSAYNIKLGQEYLAKLFEEFGPNPVLVAVAYNAGPTRARRWIEERGHPGARNVDVIDWIETIPFRETRNYAMRVAESLAPYRARRAGKVVPLSLLEEISAR